MYKFVVIQSSCGSSYDITKAEKTANDMQRQGFELVEAYQSTTAGCGAPQSVLVMIFKKV